MHEQMVKEIIPVTCKKLPLNFACLDPGKRFICENDKGYIFKNRKNKEEKILKTENKK